MPEKVILRKSSKPVPQRKPCRPISLEPDNRTTLVNRHGKDRADEIMLCAGISLVEVRRG